MWTHEFRRNLLFALILTGIIVWAVKAPLTPAQAFDRWYPDAQVVAVAEGDGHLLFGQQWWLHSHSDGEELVRLWRRGLTWGPGGTSSPGRSLEGGVRFGGSRMGALGFRHVVVYGYAPEPDTVRAIVVGGHEIDLNGEHYFLEVLPEDTPTGIWDVYVDLVAGTVSD